MSETTEPASAARRRSRVDRATLRADLRRLIPDTGAALVVTALIFAILCVRIEAGTSQTIMVMPFLADLREYWLYIVCQAFGWSALLWAWITIMFGLIRSSAPVSGSPITHARWERWHRVTSLTTIGLMFAHMLAFFIELVRADEEGLGPGGRLLSAFVDVFVPGGYSTGTGQVAILIGLIAFYLAIPLGLAYYVRSWTGPRVWRVLHRFVIVVYVLSVWHTLLYGTNVWFDGWFRTVVWLLQIPVAALLLARLLAPLRREERFRWSGEDLLGRARALGVAGARLALAGTLVLLVGVVATGNDGGRSPDVPAGEMLVDQGMVWGGLVVLLLILGTAVAMAWSRPSRGGAARERERTR
ncbi:ferric reductase-like transmembrane domain-containing protein [Nocardiopsis alba]|uniref:Iron reductase n=1 Tax=Nocardiopsis alba TaxID=53437 RepID=A0A7K2ITT0_9ACTN|nr:MULTISPECIES: ferric reductase-like transmembrane domain-containing protein [Nocardiopsis]MEC3893747.1 ferric reductase-like transmembrane domain-containing protein [Nocardiopsis sp. LDBS1602]MYR33333.1 iron reductase [Nocardiopsis alba]